MARVQIGAAFVVFPGGEVEPWSYKVRPPPYVTVSPGMRRFDGNLFADEHTNVGIVVYAETIEQARAAAGALLRQVVEAVMREKNKP